MKVTLTFPPAEWTRLKLLLELGVVGARHPKRPEIIEALRALDDRKDIIIEIHQP